MDTINFLSDDILRKQVCQECFNYLSVPPIVINDQGQTVCGRCVGLEEHGDNSKSLFNIVAKGFYFKCVNHFNGCTKILAFEEVQSHEKECTYEPQQCIFCSFPGNLSQIFNHAVKTHPEHVSFDGIIPLPLFNHSLKKKLLLPIKDNHLLVVTIELTESLFRITLELIKKELSLNINQYTVKFYKPEDQEFNNYGLFSINIRNTIEKPKEELVKIFGLTNIRCQILLDMFTSERNELELEKRILELRRAEEHMTALERKLEKERSEIVHCKTLMDTLKKKELELKKKVLDLQHSEELLTNLQCELKKERAKVIRSQNSTDVLQKKQLELEEKVFDLQHTKEQLTHLTLDLQIKDTELLRQRKNCVLAMEIIKKMSRNFFKCCQCHTIVCSKALFCPKFHCFCVNCVSSLCGVCNAVKEFTDLSYYKITVSCDWPSCVKNVQIKKFWSHKIECKFRSYKCPVKSCNKIISSVEGLKAHWHANPSILIFGNELICDKYGCKEYYWVFRSDIYHVTINFDATSIQAYVEEYDVLQDTVEFKCSGYDPSSLYHQNLVMSQFCGRYQIERRSCKYTSIKIGI